MTIAITKNRPRFEAYCDESRPELFVAQQAPVGNSAIGSVWMPADFRSQFKLDISRLRTEHDVWGEFKWKKVSVRKLPFYLALVDYFFSSPELRFRALIVDPTKLDLATFHNSDAELGFYKLYYQLLHHWIEPGSDYSIFCDDKVNRDSTRLTTLHKVLGNANPHSSIASIQAVPSNHVVAVQMCDILLGATQWRFNQPTGASAPKKEVLQAIERHLRRRIGPTYPSEQKFNVFQIWQRGAAS